VMFMEEDVLVPAGLTDNQLPPSLVVTLVENDTASSACAGVVVNVTFCVREIVEPSVVDGVQAAWLGVTEGGAGLPVA
jgi:hypothetical protein